ncbi:isocitrate/isopropylmalate family dehydrogenase [Streptomyces sp. CA-132043]|uniref:isocitrate/isopropylmalate family dehydrogenase n=1 Tax=Streptomyces sp. CA-132043 TaxID=3240048 RepID=UPI003D90E2F1
MNDRGFGLYEPVSGTAPTIAGKNIANPIGSILSVAMMCEHAFARADARDLIESAVLATIRTCATADISLSAPPVTTAELGKAVTDRMRELATRG